MMNVNAHTLLWGCITTYLYKIQQPCRGKNSNWKDDFSLIPDKSRIKGEEEKEKEEKEKEEKEKEEKEKEEKEAFA